MAGEPDPIAVRPLPIPHGTRMSRITLAVLVFTGALVGYFLGLPTVEGASVPALATTPTAEVATPRVDTEVRTPAHYDWIEQKRTGPAQQAWGLFAAVDLSDVLYLLVFTNTDSQQDRVLWRSGDGEEWTQTPIEFGDAIVHDLDVYGDSLLLSGWLDGAPAVWRSQAAPDHNLEWTATRLETTSPALGDIRYAESTVQTEVNGEGEITVAVRAQADISPLLLEFAGETQAHSVLQLPTQPEIAAAGQRLWARVVATNNSETVHSLELPPTTVLDPASGTYIRVGLITAGSLWASSDGFGYTAVDLTGLPRAPVPQPMGDEFVTVLEDPAGGHRLWTSENGTIWRPSPHQPPPECGGWYDLVVGGPGMLLTSDSFDATCVSKNAVDWAVRESPDTALSSTGQVWIEGAEAGFLALALNSQESAVLISTDGLDWRPIEFVPGLLGTHSFLVGDRLVTNAMTNGPPPFGRRFSVWVGNPRNG